ncbi:hypothetical protein AB0F77_09155 [Streptomyces sp. NPDC026672]|uniref:hypothetical protein n=1 Tax=unclassified Streptomyces TaxID=2593676 RepID=UPI0033DC89E3
MSAPQPPVRPLPRPTGVSMRELLASCAAAAVVSRPPRDPGPVAPRPADGHDRHGGARPEAAEAA